MRKMMLIFPQRMNPAEIIWPRVRCATTMPNKALQRRPRSTVLMVPDAAVRGPAERGR
jgi:hypothetical protein